MNCNLVSDYKKAILNFEGKPDQSAEKKLIVVLKCLMWSTLHTDEREVDEAYWRKLLQLKYAISFIGLDQPHREKICLLRARCFSKEEKAEVYSIIRVLAGYFEEEMKKETERYFALKK